MTLADKICVQWSAGNTAPYDLYESTRFLDGDRVLVEARQGATPVIRRGDIIGSDIALRVEKQTNPTPLPAVDVPVLQYESDGSVMLDSDGNAVTVVESVIPYQEVTMLSLADAIDESVITCDMCGEVRDAVFTIGDGKYCKVDRAVSGLQGTHTCFDVRIRQMGGAA